VVIEYAYRYRSAYDGVFWLNETSRETLFADMTTIARLLHLPIVDERDQEAIVSTVKNQVAAHADYLLIYDNADDLSLLDDFLPLDYQCHMLITTREHAHQPSSRQPGSRRYGHRRRHPDVTQASRNA
jgi:hypothetical protein